MTRVNEEIDTLVFLGPKLEGRVWDLKHCCCTAKDACITFKALLHAWPTANREVVSLVVSRAGSDLRQVTSPHLVQFLCL